MNNIDEKRLPKIASKSSQNHQQRKREWPKYVKSFINHWGIKEEVIIQNINDIKSIIIAKFKENIWCDKDYRIK
jgi:hypothetical protein